MNDFWIIATATLLGIIGSIIGVFLMLRKMSMLSDAISHGVLPGIVVAYFFAHNRDSVIAFLGAIASGLITTFLITFLSNKIKIQTEGSIGIVFTFLFALGIVLISVFANEVDLDQDCVLYGEIAYIPLDIVVLNGVNLGAIAFWKLLMLLFVVVVVVKITFKGLVLTSFNPEFANSRGIPLALFHYILMFLVTLVTVMSFELVGSILVVAFMVLPAATAYLLSNKLKQILILGAIISLLSSTLGYYLAYFFNVSISGSIAVVLGVLFFSVLFLRKKLNFSHFL